MILRALSRACTEIYPTGCCSNATKCVVWHLLYFSTWPSPITLQGIVQPDTRDMHCIAAFSGQIHSIPARLPPCACKAHQYAHLPCTSPVPDHHSITESKAKEAPEPSNPDLSFDSQELVSSCDTSMTKAIEYLKQELAGVRSGRANPGLLESLQVNANGEHVPLKATAAVIVRNNAMLAVMVYDPSLVDAVLTAIRTSPLELKAEIEGGEIIVPIPRLSKDSLAKMAKLVKKEAEDAKVSVRHSRQKALDALKKAPLSKDEVRSLEREVQKLHDKFVKEVEALRAAKEKDLQEHH